MKLTPSPVHQLAEARGIPVYTPTSLKAPEAQAEFAALGADIAVVAAYGLLLPQAILDAPKHGCVNIHPSALPRWRGAAPLQRTIMEGDSSTACCIMQMDAGLDTGAVILRHDFTIPDGMSFGQLHDAMSHVGASLTCEALQLIAAGTATRTPQASEGVRMAAKITKADQRLDPARPAAALRQQVLGLAPAPGTTLEIAGEILKIFDARTEAGDASQPAGTLLDDALLMNTSGGTALRLVELQRPGKGRQPAPQFLQGFAAPKGTLAKMPNS
jgi:methionyl-tRNA formyltransferase